MLNLSIPDMSCGHCVKAITEAVRTLDDHAAVSADLEKKQVTIDTQLDASIVSAALTEAGYPPA